jgi:type III pantothenate kinase
MMALTYYFDIGNSRGKFWRCQEGRINYHVAIVHQGNMHELIEQLPPEFAATPDALFGASVLSAQSEADLAQACKERWGCSPGLARSSACANGIINGYDMPGRLGVDRWLAIIGVGAAVQSACIVDCGTALTVDVVKCGIHCGGYILPGLSLMSSALQIRTERVEVGKDGLSNRDSALGLGRNTGDAVRHGVLLAVVALIDRVLDGESIKHLVLTGGDADKLSLHIRRKHVVDPDLLLKGLRAYFEGRAAGLEV